MRRLSQAWQLELVKQLEGGTEGIVFSAVSEADGSPLVLKVGLPDSLSAEHAFLKAAQGRGVANLLQYDAQAPALLLEQLGDKLHDTSLTSTQQREILCDALIELWRQPLDQLDELMTGAQRARWHSDFVSENWDKYAADQNPDVGRQALEYAELCEARFDASDSVLVHGDAHPWNALVCPSGGYSLVDPDGVWGEPAIDLGVLMREWADELLAAEDVAQAALTRCAELANYSGVSALAVWQWGYLEHTSTALVCAQIGETTWAEQHMSIATALVGYSP